MILFGSLRKAVHEFTVHYHRERKHQGLGNRLIIEEEPYASSMGAIQCRWRLGEMLNYCYSQQPEVGSNVDGSGVIVDCVALALRFSSSVDDPANTPFWSGAGKA